MSRRSPEGCGAPRPVYAPRTIGRTPAHTWERQGSNLPRFRKGFTGPLAHQDALSRSLSSGCRTDRYVRPDSSRGPAPAEVSPPVSPLSAERPGHYSGTLLPVAAHERRYKGQVRTVSCPPARGVALSHALWSSAPVSVCADGGTSRKTGVCHFVLGDRTPCPIRGANAGTRTPVNGFADRRLTSRPHRHVPPDPTPPPIRIHAPTAQDADGIRDGLGD